MKRRDRYKAAAQRKKALALLAVVDRNARDVGMPVLRGSRGVEALAVFTLRAWGALAKQNGILPPSREVVVMVLDLVGQRGSVTPRQVTLRKTSPAPMPMPAVKARSA